jgi:hypothetical protein
VAFAVALAASQQTLDDVWTWVRDLPLVAEGAVWLLGFPFLVGLAIWQASWDEAVRLILIAMSAAAHTHMFLPHGSADRARRPQRGRRRDRPRRTRAQERDRGVGGRSRRARRTFGAVDGRGYQ